MEEEKLEKIKRVLLRSTEFLCDNLKPANVLRHLKAKEAISPDEVKEIRKKDTDPDQVEHLLDILQEKPLASYVTFMNFLKTKYSDLHGQIKQLEKQCNFILGNACNKCLLVL